MLRKLSLVLAVSLSLGGCAALQKIETAVSVGTTSIANPVTRERLNQLENIAILVFSGLDGWKQACINGAIPASCKAQIASVQVYTRKIPPYLIQLRLFVKNNDQVNAIVVYNNVMDLISTVKAQAATSGVNLNTTGS